MSTSVIDSPRLQTVQANRIPSVTVIERSSDSNLVVHSFPDNSQGNQYAEELFRKIASEQECEGPGIPLFDEEEITGGIDDGHMEDGNGWELFLIHSEVSSR